MVSKFEEEPFIELIFGDCVEELPTFPDNCIDLTITSPPYDGRRTYEGTLDWGKHVWKPVLEQLYRITKQHGTVVWIVNDATINGGETGTSFKQALYAKEVGFTLHDTMIWNKQEFIAIGSLKVRYAPVFDFMFVFSKGKPTFNPIKDRKNIRHGGFYTGAIRQPDGTMKDSRGKGKKQITEFGQRHNIWSISPEKSNIKRYHPAQFPEKLVHDHIISWSNECDLVLDPFMGSGTAGIVAKQLNRDFIGIEKVKEYFDIAELRINDKI